MNEKINKLLHNSDTFELGMLSINQKYIDGEFSRRAIIEWIERSLTDNLIRDAKQSLIILVDIITNQNSFVRREINTTLQFGISSNYYSNKPFTIYVLHPNYSGTWEFLDNTFALEFLAERICEAFKLFDE